MLLRRLLQDNCIHSGKAILLRAQIAVINWIPWTTSSQSKQIVVGAAPQRLQTPWRYLTERAEPHGVLLAALGYRFLAEPVSKLWGRPSLSAPNGCTPPAVS